METIVECSATLAEHKTRPAWGSGITNTATPDWCCAELSRGDPRNARQHTLHKGKLPHGGQPMAGIKIGRMAEEAWPRLLDGEKIVGMPLWKLAAIANFKFLPVQANKPMGRTPDGLFVYPLVPADKLGPVGGKQDRSGRAYVEIHENPVLKGLRLHDQFGHVLLTVGTCVMTLPGEIQSGLSSGIMDGPDTLPPGWVYRKKDKTKSNEITGFIEACLKQRTVM